MHAVLLYNERDNICVTMMRFLKNIMRSRLAVGAAFGVLAVCVFTALHPALAQSAATQLAASATAAGVSDTSLPIIIARVIRVFLGTLGIIFTVVILYAGWIYMTAQGDDTKLKQSKNMIKNGVIGMVICLSAFTITTFILNRLLAGFQSFGGGASVADQYSEPLSGSLGAGIIESHYPERNAIDVPRNTRIMVTFKEPLNPADIISGYDANPASTDLNVDNVQIYRTADVDSVDTLKLASSGVTVTMNETATIFVFDPVELLGSSTDDTNYTVALSNAIRKSDATAAFVGAYSAGYEWAFEVSTEVDLTPPRIVSVIPRESGTDARNITLSITFDEAMDPVAGTGTYAAGSETDTFSNVTVDSTTTASGYHVDGTYAISNGYKTVEFTPTEACGVDPCGDTIYCLPATADGSDDALTVTAKAATVSLTDAPQAEPIGVSFDGLVDAAANSLDGDEDGIGEGPSEDTRDWANTISNEINDTVPTIVEMHPDILEEEATNDAPITVEFSVPMRSSTLNTETVSLWPDPWYEFWFTTGKTDFLNEDGDTLYTTASVDHPAMVSIDDLGWAYDPVVMRGVKSAYQICMYPPRGPALDETVTPAQGSSSGQCGTSDAAPYCCNGRPQEDACPTTYPDGYGTETVGNTHELPDSYE